jgi:hypothetical protein
MYANRTTSYLDQVSVDAEKRVLRGESKKPSQHRIDGAGMAEDFMGIPYASSFN